MIDLAYGRQKWGRRTYRRVAAGVAVFTFSLLAAWYLPALWRRATDAALQRGCMAYAPASGHVVYDDTPAAAALLRAPGYVTPFKTTAHVAFHNPAWTAYTGRPTAVVFMHERTTPAGNRRLVVVQLWADVSGTSPSNRIGLVPFVEPPALTAANRSAAAGAFARRRGSPNSEGLELLRAPSDTLRLFDGVSDPADPSHFTLDYLFNNAAGVIDGWLNNDETVTISPRTGQVCEPWRGFALWSPGRAPLPGWSLRMAQSQNAAVMPIRPPRLR